MNHKILKKISKFSLSLPNHRSKNLELGSLIDLKDSITALEKGLVMEAEGKAVVFSGDTAYFPPLAEFARGADLLVHEAIEPGGIDRLVARVGNADGRLRRHLHASHTPVEDVGRIAAAAGVGDGIAAVIGGPAVYAMFLDRFDTFWLDKA